MPHAMQIRQAGGPEVLNRTAVDVGEPGSGQVRLRQAAAGLNYIDVYHRTGYYQPLLFIPGLEGAGTVEAVAQDVRSEGRRSGGLCRPSSRPIVFALKDAADAHKALEARATSGSTILTI